jgi:Flp pilus assembly protein TadG
MTRRLAGRSTYDRRGQALAEFALVFPIFALLFFGMIDIGRYVFLANELNQVAREGARYGAVTYPEINDGNHPVVAAICPASVVVRDRFSCTDQVTRDRMVGYTLSDANVTVSCGPINGAANANPDACEPPHIMTVEVKITSFRLITPIVSHIVGPRDVTGTAQVVVQ